MTQPIEHYTLEQVEQKLNDAKIVTVKSPINSLWATVTIHELHALLNAAFNELIGEPALFLAKNLHNSSYATSFNKAEAELFLLQSGLKVDGIESVVLPLYTLKEPKP